MESLIESDNALERALAETESLVSAISSIVIGLDQDNRIIRWNASAEQMFGFSSATMLDRCIQSAEIRWDWDVLMIAIHDCREQQQPLRVPELSYLDRTGTERLLEITLSPLLRKCDMCYGLLLLGRDVTQQKHLEAQLAMAQKLKSLGELAAGVAHEINTPIHYAAENIRFLQKGFCDIQRLLDMYRRMFLQIQQAYESDESMNEVTKVVKEIDLDYLQNEIPCAFTQCLEGIDRVADIVRAMNEFSHPGSQGKTVVDLNHSLQSAMILTSKEWKDVAEVVTEFAVELPPVLGSPTQLTQVWINLLVNAVQAIQELRLLDSSKKGTIRITTRQDGDWVEVRLSDTGIGIPESVRSNVFDLFFTTKESGKGTGQGLALAHSIIVQNHEGALFFESVPMSGTTFVVRLPLRPATGG